MQKILVVDDEKKIRELYQKFLTFENYEVTVAEDAGVAAEKLIHDEEISLVLLDINMPVVDGSILYDMVRMLDDRIRVIVTSAYPLEDQKRMIVRADDYYDKSQGTEVLLEKVKNAFRERSDVKH